MKKMEEDSGSKKSDWLFDWLSICGLDASSVAAAVQMACLLCHYLLLHSQGGT